ncbi:hypothetical protein FRC12_024525 [Ceratobasidium sp. 428]|nr:hypothetical protein FRC12_024525 [Ceratobasidium sp. 428]
MDEHRRSERSLKRTERGAYADKKAREAEQNRESKKTKAALAAEANDQAFAPNHNIDVIYGDVEWSGDEDDDNLDYVKYLVGKVAHLTGLDVSAQVAREELGAEELRVIIGDPEAAQDLMNTLTATLEKGKGKVADALSQPHYLANYPGISAGRQPEKAQPHMPSASAPPRIPRPSASIKAPNTKHGMSSNPGNGANKKRRLVDGQAASQPVTPRTTTKPAPRAGGLKLQPKVC